MSAWGDIIESAARFEPVAREHGLHLGQPPARGRRGPPAAAGRGPRPGARAADAARGPVADGVAWIDALCSLLDVPPEELPHPDRWAPITDEVLEHRLALEDLPLVDDPRGG